MVADLNAYSNVLTARSYRRLWREQSRETRSVTRGKAQRSQGMFHVALPFTMPKVMKGLLGDGAPNIDVSGSETITLSGVSDWTVRPKDAFDTERKRQSAFPSLEMKQDLQVNLTGSIGDKIKVDVDQSSNVQTSIDNKVKLRYEGDEDDMIKSIDLGNTNLSLQGASIRQEGLFGVKTVAKLGNVDLVTIVSKQEGKSENARFTPTGEKRRVTIRDLEYIKRQYYLIANHPINWDPATLQVFRDDQVTSNSNSVPDGIARLDPTQDSNDSSATNPQLHGRFEVLNQGVDYDVLFPYVQSGGGEIPVIRFHYPLNINDVIGVTYVERDSVGNEIRIGDPSTYLLKAIKVKSEDITTVAGGAYDPADDWYPALGYELRNFYDLTARNIARETLTLKIRKLDASQAVDPDAINSVPLVQITGLDQHGATVDTGPDGKLDDRFLDVETGILFFPDLHPFDPGCQPQFPLCLDDMNRNTLSDSTLANPNVYYTRATDITNQTRYYIDAEFKSSQQGYFLGRFNILENSEQVKVDNLLQRKGIDYNIDYDTGQITFSRPPGPDQVISVDYSFAPGVAQVQRTLMGFSTSYSPSADLSVTSSMLYESRGAQELNPKLGEEPARSMVGDLASILTFRPSWMTQFANVIPGVHTAAPSQMNIQGNIAVSVPNPNTKGEAYLEDMEGNRESNQLTLGRTTWLWSSIPLDTIAEQPVSMLVSDHALIQWYNPIAARGGPHERDLKPILTKEEGGDNEHTVLEMNVVGPADSTNFSPVTWSGLTQPLSRVGQDLSRTRYVEIWVNDRTPIHSQTHARLHLDFGRVSEDAFWERNALPNGVLDTEDKNGDTKLDEGEDTGLDGIPNEDELGSTGPTDDRNGDDYEYRSEDPLNYSKINGTERNRDVGGTRPDTEDLDLSGGPPNTENSYFEATLDLADTAYVAVDVPRDYAGNPNVKEDNGWRLFRIPLDSGAFRSFGGPNWDDIKHARIWIDGMTGPTNLQIGGIELVGSRWLASPLPDPMRNRGVVFDVKVRNNKDDAAFYTAPFDVPNAVGGNATRREQSLALVYDGLEPGDSLFSFKTSADNGSGIGYTQYRDIRFYVHGDAGVEVQNLYMVARFGADTVNYYEYSLPVKSGWQDVRIPMEILSRLKESNDTLRVRIDSLTAADTGARYTVVGRPTFTRVNRLTFGLTVFGGTTGSPGPPGEVWIDELRLDGVRKEVGKTGNLAIQANFADVLSMNVGYSKQDQDFFRVGSGVNQGTGLNHTSVGFSSTLALDKMLPLSGLQFPLRLTVSHSSDVPKYRTGSDVILDQARSDVETRSSDRQAVDFSYSRTGPRKGWTKWTIDAIRGSMAYSREANIDPQSTDSSWTFSTRGSYDIPVGGGKGFGLGKRTRVKYLPEIVSFGADWSASRRTAYSRFIQGTEDSAALRSNVLSRLLTLRTGATYLPINGITTKYSLASQRDMLIRREGALGNVGTETDHRQTMELNWAPRRVLFLNPNITLLGSYHEDASAGVRLSASDRFGLKNIQNTGSVQAQTSIPLSRFTQQYKNQGGARDSSGGSAILAPVRFLLSRVQDIQTTFAFRRSASASRVAGNPGFAYVTGFTDKLAPTLFSTESSKFIQNRSYNSTVSTKVEPLNRLTVDVRADHRLSYSDALLGARRTYTLSWPDLNGSWLQLQQPLGLEGMLSSLVVSSHYSVSNEDQGPQGKPIETHTRTTNWGPLLKWEASFRNGIRADVTSAMTQTAGLDQRLGGLIRSHTTTNHDVRLTKTYPAARGIRFPWSKRRVKLPNDVNLNLSMGIARDRSVSDRAGFETLVETDTQRLNVGSGTTYNFTPSITGGFDLAFRQTKDYKAALTNRGITIAVNAQFRF
ncbi:MAG TPA: hypothetical protein VK527_10940 [Candidatus Limnocylindrales bacterium]|nr:hypothetical protein [Candidatus Limnocylindrales bacterium]